ncbi:hypothetical protein [Lachnoclostridium phytofermentans]|uniref:hypothetical protein n=1 Tax=Lachnoclostridium phytofermentans TaxID=66219 RepID=UPI0012DE1B44|nr:hypothetical protein [Lachnoclostridium phytofermentans]
MADNSHGTNNELEMSNYLDGKKFKDLNLTMKEFIKYILCYQRYSLHRPNRNICYIC